MKIYTIALLFFTNVAILSPAHAARFHVTGNVKLLDLTDSYVNTYGSVVEVSGFSAAGTCYVNTETGLVRIRVKNDENGSRQYSLLLSSAMAKQPVFVEVDDNYKDEGGYYCLLRRTYISP